MLAILGNFGNSDPKGIVQEILTYAITESNGDFLNLRKIRHLRVLAQLRNLPPQNINMDEYKGFFNEENDIFYKRGEMKAKMNCVYNLLMKTNFTIPKIAHLTGSTQAFVRKVKKSTSD